MVLEMAAKAAVDAEIAELKQKIRSVEEKLRRLRNARDDLSPAKDTVRDLRDGIKKHKDLDNAWHGKTSRAYETDMDRFYASYKQYYSLVGNALSSIKRKIILLELELKVLQAEMMALSLVG